MRVICSFLTTLVQSHKCSHCTCTLSALFCRNDGAVKGSCICVCTLFALFSHNLGAVRQMQCTCTLFPHSVGAVNKAVCVCARYLLQVGAVRQSSLCMCTLFAPSWCCQINQSLYVRVFCYVLSQRWCCQKNQSQSDI